MFDTLQEISSYKIDLNDITIEEIIALYQYTFKSNLNVYFYCENVIADAGNLPKLLSFFFITAKRNPIVMIIDGENVQEGYNNIASLLHNQAMHAELRVNHKVTSDKAITI
ncbi:hypothetical protein [Virgibacillus ainsalahensis]